VHVLPQTKFYGDVLCFGTCDLHTIRPRNQIIWTWADRLSQQYSVDSFAQHCSLDVTLALLNNYLRKHRPRIICFTLQIYGETVHINDRYFMLHENINRVLKFLELKKIFSKEQSMKLMEKVNDIQLLSKNYKIEKNHEYFNKIVKLIKEHNIIYYWTYNPTKTANKFYQDMEAFDDDNYLGFLENLDILPESSIGDQTQNILYEKFLERIKKHDHSRCSKESPPTFTNTSQILV
jgi:hypothetical protein